MKKVISFSLWGKNPKYTIGAVKNAILAKEVYPGWEARFYCGKSVPEEIIDQLKKENANVISAEEEGDWTGMFWRFLAAADPTVDVMISRDTDSRLSLREKAAVDEWLTSGKTFHIMRDHPAHGTEILGGMWGVRCNSLRNIDKMVAAYTKGNFWQVDQNFLRSEVWPIAKFDCYVNDDFFEKKPWPIQRLGLEFVGQVFDENEETVEEHAHLLQTYLKSKQK